MTHVSFVCSLSNQVRGVTYWSVTHQVNLTYNFHLKLPYVVGQICREQMLRYLIVVTKFRNHKIPQTLRVIFTA